MRNCLLQCVLTLNGDFDHICCICLFMACSNPSSFSPARRPCWSQSGWLCTRPKRSRMRIQRQLKIKKSNFKSKGKVFSGFEPPPHWHSHQPAGSDWGWHRHTCNSIGCIVTKIEISEQSAWLELKFKGDYQHIHTTCSRWRTSQPEWPPEN